MGQLRKRVLQVDDGRPQRLLAREGEELPHQRRRPVGVLPDLHQVAMLHVGHVVAHEQQVAVPVDGGQEVVEVVRHAPGELAHRLHLLALHELRLERLELGRVRDDGEKRGGAVEHGAGEGHLQEDFRPVAGQPRDLGPAEGAALRGVGQPLGDRPAEPLEEIGDVRTGPGAVAEKLARRLVGVGEPPAGLEPRQRDGQILEEMVGHEAGDLGAVQRHQQQVAPAVGAGKGQRAHRLAGGGEHVHPVGAQRRIGEDRVEVGAALHQGGGGGVLFQHPALGVDAQPGEAGVREARDRGGRRAPALEAPEKRAAAHAGHHHPSAVLGLLHRDAVQPRLAGQPVARRPGGEARLRPGAAGGGVGAEDATLEVADHDRLAMAVEAADRSRAVARHQGEEAGAKREEVAAENEERDGKRAGNDGGPGPELGQRRGEQQRPRRREPRAGPEVAAQGRGPCLSLVLHQSARPLASGQSRPNCRVQP